MNHEGPTITLAVLQAALGGSREENTGRIEQLMRGAADRGAQVLLPPELFESPYFPKTKDEEFFSLAAPVEGHPTLRRFCALAAELSVAFPFSFFERAGARYFNSVAMIDADGSVLGIYRKSHVPEGPGYEEKFYFSAGDTGFRVWPTRYGCIGVGICWDQWFPECARALVLAGAQLLLFPSAIGSEPDEPTLDTRAPWQRVMCGHAVANSVPVAAANRIGDEDGQVFYGHSFIADHQGSRLAQLDCDEEGFALAVLDLAASDRYRADFGLLRDRRPSLYGSLVSPESASRKRG